MKYLAVDVGNTKIKYAIIDGDIGSITRGATTEIDSIAEEIAQVRLPVALASVRPGAADKIKSALDSQGGKLLVEIKSDIARPVTGFYTGMGADRIADVAGAWSFWATRRPVAVVGLGTGTTITTVDSDGVFQGGLTTLGLGPICKTLTEALPALPPIDPKQVGTVKPGFDVYSALCHGTVAAHIGLIEHWVKIFKEKLGHELRIVATGGWSELIGAKTKCIDHVEPLLTFQGIKAIVADLSSGAHESLCEQRTNS